MEGFVNLTTYVSKNLAERISKYVEENRDRHPSVSSFLRTAALHELQMGRGDDDVSATPIRRYINTLAERRRDEK